MAIIISFEEHRRVALQGLAANDRVVVIQSPPRSTSMDVRSSIGPGPDNIAYILSADEDEDEPTWEDAEWQ